MILAFETSTRRASLSVCDPGTGTVAASAEFTTDRAHNAAIFAPLQKLVDAHREQLRAFLVGLGPGSYGGVRVGIAVANGLSVAMGLPVFGRNSLEAWETDEDSYLVVGDARRGSFFVAVVRDRILQGEPELIDEAAISDRLAPLLAEGLAVHSSDPKAVAAIPGARLSFPHAARLAARFEALPATEPLEPIYLRAPYITTPKARG
ncbi:MAG TPA: tRNA (adenosine(37)-N6)-threonylcarbamoyltransferase complex dimerization subunit type 1 TsaB [Bacteroidia bacterium]|nr:tRNA (adenosine(37)-N6)-threonylcarbamoyltransferase complex dimerization subunit type 1 TsaB [Bacteroidia bacterium]